MTHTVLGTWRLPSGNECTVTLRAACEAVTHVHFTWLDSIPGWAWSAEDWSVYLCVVRPAASRLADEHTGRTCTQQIDAAMLTDLDMSGVR